MVKSTNILTRFWQELKRRKVFKVLTMYAGSAFVIIQVIDILAAPLNLPPWIMTLIIILLSIGFPLAAILAWIFDLTPEGIKKTESLEELAGKEIVTVPGRRRLKASDIIIVILLIAVIILAWPRIFKRDTVKRLSSSGEKVAVAVMPFQNMTNDTVWNVYQKAIQWSLISSLSKSGELGVRQRETLDQLTNTKGFNENASVSPAIAAQISKKLDADIYILGSIQNAGPLIRVEAQLIDTKTKDVLSSAKVEMPPLQENIIPIIDSLGKKVIDFFSISKLIKEDPVAARIFPSSTNSPDALGYFSYGLKAMGRYDLATAIKWFESAMAADTNFIAPMMEIAFVYRNSRNINKALPLVLKLYGKRDHMSRVDRLRTDYLHATYFEPIDIQISLIKQLQEIDDQGNYHRILAGLYSNTKQYDKAILEYEKSLEIWRKWGREFLEGNISYPALGEIYHKSGQYKKARRLYREAERVNDNHSSEFFSWIIRDQAALSLTEGDAVEANKYIEKLISVLKENSFSKASIAAQMALMYKQAGNLDNAEEYYRKALSLEPESPQRLNSLAAFLIANDRRVEEGLQFIDKALLLNPGNGDYLDTKAMGLYKLGKYNEALALLEKAKDLKNPFYSYEICNHIEEVKKAIAGQK